MKLIESGQEIHFIDVDSDRVPCSLLVKLTDRTYRMTFAYNEAADFFTVSLEISNSGGNTPLVQEDSDVYCIVGNIIDRQPENGGNGCGYQQDLAYTLTALDRHAVYARQRVDEFKNDNIASTQSARQAKDATDLVVESDRQYAQLIRRLTPLECERLQGLCCVKSYVKYALVIL